MNGQSIKRLWKDAAFCAASAALVYLFFANSSHCIDGRPAGAGYVLWFAVHDRFFLLTLLLFSLAVGFAVTATICWGVGSWRDAALDTEVIDHR